MEKKGERERTREQKKQRIAKEARHCKLITGEDCISASLSLSLSISLCLLPEGIFKGWGGCVQVASKNRTLTPPFQVMNSWFGRVYNCCLFLGGIT